MSKSEQFLLRREALFLAKGKRLEMYAASRDVVLEEKVRRGMLEDVHLTNL
jgi:hypothetical protein